MGPTLRCLCTRHACNPTPGLCPCRVQVEALLGPKTEEDLKPVEKKKVKPAKEPKEAKEAAPKAAEAAEVEGLVLTGCGVGGGHAQGTVGAATCEWSGMGMGDY